MVRNKNSDAARNGAGTLRKSPARLLRKIEQLEHEVALARRFAYHDPLTRLPNRALMLDRLKQAIFKKVNDELGHQAGDAVLQGVADRLRGCIRECDTACRYGGDEFVVLLPEIEGAEELELVRRKIQQQLWLPHHIGKRSLVVGGSIGSALFRQDAESCVALIDVADAAMYRAKRLSREEGSVPRAAANI
jgi:diguanylate cyclase (GGDEF)-like protein